MTVRDHWFGGLGELSPLCVPHGRATRVWGGARVRVRLFQRPKNFRQEFNGTCANSPVGARSSGMYGPSTESTCCANVMILAGAGVAAAP